MERWPNLFIVGAPKAGTSSIYVYLKNIQDICMSDIKEPNYFSSHVIPDNSPLNPIRDKKEYLNLFSDCLGKKFRGEASPSYLADTNASAKINKVSPESKIVISLRDPIERAFSAYLMLDRYDRTNLSFHEEIERTLKGLSEKNSSFEYSVITRSLYYDNVKRFIDTFGKNQVKIVIFEDFIKNPELTVKQILEFLGLKTNHLKLKYEVFNPYVTPRGKIGRYVLKNRKIRRIAEKTISPSTRKKLKEKFVVHKGEKPKIDEGDRRTLTKFYNDDVLKIQRLLGIQLPWRNFQN